MFLIVIVVGMLLSPRPILSHTMFQPVYLEYLSRFEKGSKLLLRYLDLTTIDELEDFLEVTKRYL